MKKTEEQLKIKHKEHYDLVCEIAKNINTTSDLINRLGELPITGVENIDNLYYALNQTQSKVIEVFEVLEEKC